METKLQINELAKAMASAQGELHAALKSATNPHFKSKYANLEEVWEACRDALSKYKVAVIQCPQFDEKCDYLETTLVHESGQYMTSKIMLRNAKGDMQGLGSAITYSRRYALAAMVGVIAEDDDGNAASGRKQASSEPEPDFYKRVQAMKASFAELGVFQNAIEGRVGKLIQDFDENDMAGLRSWITELRAERDEKIKDSVFKS